MANFPTVIFHCLMIYQIKLLKCFNYGFVPPLELSCATHFTFSES